MILAPCFKVRGPYCGKIRRKLRFFNFLHGRKRERFNLDLPLVANVEHLIEADFTASELRHTDFYFLHSGLALTGMYM